MRSWVKWLLGGTAVGGALLLAGTAQAAPAAPPLQPTADEDKLNDAIRRLRNYLAAARLDATARRLAYGDGYVIEVVPGPKLVVEDWPVLARGVELTQRLTGVSIVIKR